MVYFFISTIRNTSDEVTPSIFTYEDLNEAEIKFHDEVSYALKLDNIRIAHFCVVDECGGVANGLEKTINNLIESASDVISDTVVESE